MLKKVRLGKRMLGMVLVASLSLSVFSAPLHAAQINVSDKYKNSQEDKEVLYPNVIISDGVILNYRFQYTKDTDKDGFIYVLPTSATITVNDPYLSDQVWTGSDYNTKYKTGNAVLKVGTDIESLSDCAVSVSRVKINNSLDVNPDLTDAELEELMKNTPSWYAESSDWVKDTWIKKRQFEMDSVRQKDTRILSGDLYEVDFVSYKKNASGSTLAFSNTWGNISFVFTDDVGVAIDLMRQGDSATTNRIFSVDGKSLDAYKVPSTNRIRVFVNGELKEFKNPVVNKNGTTFYPFRELCEAIDAPVGWDMNTRTAKVFTSTTQNFLGTEIYHGFTIDSNKYFESSRYYERTGEGGTPEFLTENRTEYTMSENEIPFIQNGLTYLPVRRVCEALGKTVVWDNASKILAIEW